jgi:hypothetical protein
MEEGMRADCDANGRYKPEQIDRFIQELRADGVCILKAHFSRSLLANWNQAFTEVLYDRIRNGTASPRGPNRYYISLPFTRPFADPAVYEDSDILAVLEAAAQGELVMPELASDTPLRGSDYQVIHRDHKLRSPDLLDLDPSVPFQFAVNFPLVDVTLDNGPFEIARGTHIWSDAECSERTKAGHVKLEPLLMNAGDVMIRDVRGLHRGTPNRTDQPRPMVVVGYNRIEHRRPQLRILIPQHEKAGLSPRGSRLLRLNPVVDVLTGGHPPETYSNLYFLEEA